MRTVSCEVQADATLTTGDCDDADEDISPAVDEQCDGIDNNCDDLIDDEDAGVVDRSYWYRDGDGDGYGVEEDRVFQCFPPEGYVELITDCDDDDSARYPAAVEFCMDGVDNNCDGVVDDCTMSLADADATLWGHEQKDYVGKSLTGAGDLNQDGWDDIVVGALWAGEYSCGEVSIVYGPISGEHVLADVADVVFWNEEENYLGQSIAVLDIDGDGGRDVVTSSYNAPAYDGSTAGGAVYVKYGPFAPGAIQIGVEADTILRGAEQEYAGATLVNAGDVEGDGADELLVGAHGASALGVENSGVAYLLTYSDIEQGDLSEATARVVGESSYDFGYGVQAAAGDVDGDGFSDVLIGATGQSGDRDHSGAAFLFLGPIEGTRSLGDADLKVSGIFSDTCIGSSLSVADLDDDGVKDLLIGDLCDPTNAEDSGAVYLVSGTERGDFSLTNAIGRLLGENRDDKAGIVEAVDDFNQDGRSDILVGAHYHDETGSNAGAVYLILEPVNGTQYLEDAALKLYGINSGAWAGAVLAGVGDVNADGAPDIAIGAYGTYRGDVKVGAVHLLFGGPI